MAFGNDYDDLNAEDGDAACISPLCPNNNGGSNENTLTTCSDGIDNDMDNLVDCADIEDCGKEKICKKKK